MAAINTVSDWENVDPRKIQNASGNDEEGSSSMLIPILESPGIRALAA